jgi:membrane protein implicated in regulation of membrane protease activity
MSDAQLEQLMQRRVLPAMFMAVVAFCLALMTAALLDGAWLAGLVHAGAALSLAWLADSCRTRGDRSSEPPTQPVRHPAVNHH